MKWTIIFYEGLEYREGVMVTGEDATLTDVREEFQTAMPHSTLMYVMEGTPKMYSVNEENGEVRICENQ